MKPLLERKRRARINKCLDELKDIMTVALQAQGENVSKLEKADILELTVRHLHKLQKSEQLMTSPSPRNPLEEVHRFQAGYSSCAQEAASFLLSSPGVDVRVSQRLLTHLTTNIASGPFVPQQQPPPRPQLLPCSTPVVPNMFQTPPKFSGVPTTASPTTFPLSRTSSPVTRPLHGLHSPPVVSLERKVTPPPRPNSNPNLSTAANASCHFTVKIMKTEKGAAAHAPIKPEPIRLNPNDPVWRPF